MPNASKHVLNGRMNGAQRITYDCNMGDKCYWSLQSGGDFALVDAVRLPLSTFGAQYGIKDLTDLSDCTAVAGREVSNRRIMNTAIYPQ